MALYVIFNAPSPVKITHVTYKVDHVWIVNMEFMVDTVTCRVQQTVKTTNATFITEPA